MVDIDPALFVNSLWSLVLARTSRVCKAKFIEFSASSGYTVMSVWLDLKVFQLTKKKPWTLKKLGNRKGSEENKY